MGGMMRDGPGKDSRERVSRGRDRYELADVLVDGASGFGLLILPATKRRS